MEAIYIPAFGFHTRPLLSLYFVSPTQKGPEIPCICSHSEQNISNQRTHRTFILKLIPVALGERGAPLCPGYHNTGGNRLRIQVSIIWHNVVMTQPTMNL